MLKIITCISICFVSVVHAAGSSEILETKKTHFTPKVHLKSTFYGDNRERIPVDEPYAPSYTLLGLVNQLYLSTGEGSLNFQLGLSHRVHLGGKLDEEPLNILAWFDIAYHHLHIRLGMMPFDLVTDIHPALLEEAHFRYPVLEGMYLNYKNQKMRLKLWLDWVGRQTEQRREAFLLGLSFKSKLLFGFGAAFDTTLFHHAGLMNGPDVLEENGGLLAQLFYQHDLTYFGVATKHEVSAGYYLAYARDRNISTDWQTSSKFIGQFNTHTKYLGLDSELSTGKSKGLEVDFRRPAYQSQKYIQISPILHIPQINLRFQWDFEVIDHQLTQMQRMMVKFKYQR